MATIEQLRARLERVERQAHDSRTRRLALAVGLTVVGAASLAGYAFAGPVGLELDDIQAKAEISATAMRDRFTEIQAAINDNDMRVTENAEAIASNADAIASNTDSILAQAAPNFAISPSSGVAPNVTQTLGAVPGLEVTIETDGEPVFITLTGTDAQTASLDLNTVDGEGEGTIQVRRAPELDPTDIETVFDTRLGRQSGNGGSITVPPGVVAVVDEPPAGTWVYQVWAAEAQGDDSLQINFARLVAVGLATAG